MDGIEPVEKFESHHGRSVLELQPLRHRSGGTGRRCTHDVGVLPGVLDGPGAGPRVHARRGPAGTRPGRRSQPPSVDEALRVGSGSRRKGNPAERPAARSDRRDACAFDFTAQTEELWVPIAFTPERKAQHDEHYLQVYGRLKPTARSAEALAELRTNAERLRKAFPHDNPELGFAVATTLEELVGDYPRRLYTLLGAVGFVLLIACGNIANLLLARGAARSTELAIRTSLGAGRGRIVRQLLTESVVLALVSAAAGSGSRALGNSGTDRRRARRRAAPRADHDRRGGADLRCRARPRLRRDLRTRASRPRRASRRADDVERGRTGWKPGRRARSTAHGTHRG